jgi:hypothetical protein
MREARGRAAAGVVLAVVLVPALAVLLGWATMTQPLYPRPSPGGSGKVDPERLARVVRLLSEEFTPRDHLHPGNLQRVAAFIRNEMERTGAAVTEQRFEVGDRTYSNVLAAFGPDSGERVVVGAHYDVWEEFPGADDNASGVAGLLEIGRLLGAEAPAGRVELAAYALEEPPHYAEKTMGSAVHAAGLRARGVRVRAMIALEMIGYFDDRPGSQRFPVPFLGWIYPREGNFIAVVGKLGQGWIVRRVKEAMQEASPLPVHSINAPRLVPGIDFSDHRNFWDAGYPAVMITDTAFYRNPNYHSAGDTADTLDYRRMGQVIDGVHAAVRSLAR